MCMILDEALRLGFAYLFNKENLEDIIPGHTWAIDILGLTKCQL